MPLLPADLATVTALFHRMKDPELRGMEALRLIMAGVGDVLRIIARQSDEDLASLLLSDARPLHHIAQALEQCEQSLREGLASKVQ